MTIRDGESDFPEANIGEPIDLQAHLFDPHSSDVTGVGAVVHLWTCQACGAAVADRGKAIHKAWHDRKQAIRQPNGHIIGCRGLRIVPDVSGAMDYPLPGQSAWITVCDCPPGFLQHFHGPPSADDKEFT